MGIDQPNDIADLREGQRSFASGNDTKRLRFSKLISLSLTEKVFSAAQLDEAVLTAPVAWCTQGNYIRRSA